MKFNSQKYYSLPAKMVFIIFGVSSFLFIIAYVLLSLHSDSARNSYFRANKLNLLIIDLKNDFLEYNTAERKSAFYLYGHDESSEIVIDKITNLYSFINMDEMSGKEIKLGVNKKNNSNMEAIPFLVKSIDRIFQKLVSLESAIGNQEYGLKEDLIIANSQLVLETQITTDTILRVKLADMYELSEQTLTEPNDLIQANYLKESQEFIDMLKPEKKEKLSDSDKSLLTTVGNHRLKYIQFINAVNTLGFDENSGIRKKMFRLMAELKQLTEEHLIHQTDVYKEIVSVNNKIFRIIILIYIIILGLLIYRIYRVYKRYLERIDRYLIYLQEGELNILQNSEANSEMPVIKILSKIFSNLREKDKHLNEIISGSLAEFDTVYHPYDVLGQSLLKMEKTVISERKARKNEEMQKQRETRRIKGLTKFAAILRENAAKPKIMAQELVNELVDFLGIQMGGFYILDPSGEVPVYNLVAAYAYSQKKEINKKVREGIGLVGTAAADKISFYYDELPDDYLSIVTGFGQASPKTLLIQPLISGDMVLGVLELASLSKFSKEDIVFIESLASDIASALRFIVVEQETEAESWQVY